MARIFLKKHIQGEKIVIAAADEEIIGQEFQEENRKIFVSDLFYRGDLLEIEEALKILKSARNINLVGQNIVSAAVEARIIHEFAIITVQGVPHALKFIL
ncbi:MAG TPA: DUF424 family protein [Candidatus Lokiarchaeia archaeon]|nr:DUF424 family protein [Candidatus Lokiarchaeia archaeon]